MVKQTGIEGHPSPRILFSGLVVGAQLSSMPGAHADAVDDWTRRFAASEIVFQHSTSNVPFPPLAFIEVSVYNDIDVVP